MDYLEIAKQLRDFIFQDINRGENRAIEDFDKDLKIEFFRLESSSINNEHYQTMLEQLLLKTIADYDNLKNFYKDFDNQFKASKMWDKENSFTDDRIEFISNEYSFKCAFEMRNLPITEYGKFTREKLKDIESVVYETKILEIKRDYLKYHIKNLNKTTSTPPPVKSPFSVLEWATIFYYADETNLLPESRFIKTRIEQFINKYKIDTTLKHFRTQYYEAKNRINKKNNYPINKLELIIPFLKENFKQTVTKVENDIIFLEENSPEY